MSVVPPELDSARSRTGGLAGCLIGPLVACLLAGCSRDAPFPSRPIELVCPWSAGGGTDRVSRQLALQLERRLGVPVHVVNATGGSGVTGFTRGALSRPDGHTVTMLTVELSMLHWRGLTDITAADFAPLALLNRDPAAVFVRHDAPATTLAELEAEIRARPGRLKAGGTAQGGIWHAAVVGWLDACGLSGDAVTWVSLNGAGPSLQELVAGGLDLVCCSLPEADAMLASARVRCLGTMSAERLPTAPLLPTFREQGVDWVLSGWRGLGVPASTPADRVAALAAAVAEEATSPEFRQFLSSAGFDHSFEPPADFTATLATQDALFGRLLGSTAFEGVAADAFGPLVFPSVAAGLLALSIAFSRADSRPSVEPVCRPSAGSPRGGLIRAAAIVAAVAAFILLVEPLGFAASCGLVLAGLMLAFGVGPMPAAALAVAAAIVLQLTFVVLLRVPLPQGLWGG